MVGSHCNHGAGRSDGGAGPSLGTAPHLHLDVVRERLDPLEVVLDQEVPVLRIHPVDEVAQTRVSLPAAEQFLGVRGLRADFALVERHQELATTARPAYMVTRLVGGDRDAIGLRVPTRLDPLVRIQPAKQRVLRDILGVARRDPETPSDAPEVSLLFIKWSRDLARRVASLRGPGGKLMLVHENDIIEGMRIVSIRPDAVELHWRGTNFLLLAAR